MEDDHEELLQYTDDESLSETEDHCCPIEKPDDRCMFPLTFFPHTKLQFFVTLLLLILSSIALLIILPLYINKINVQGNVYSLIVLNAFFSTLIFFTILILMKFVSSMLNQKILSLPINFWKLLQLACIYVSCGYLYFYGSDRNRVLCHLQDPIKGIVLVFALLYYFFFCRNLMGLHRIFSTTTVIVGLFIAVDYGLCDEFVCRGYDRQQVSDDAGSWSWKTHSIWTGLYIFSLILFAAFFTILDRYIAPEYELIPSNIISPSFLNTISRSVTAPSSDLEGDSQEPRRQHDEFPVRKSAVHFAFWIHIFVSVIVVITFWIDFVPGIGKGDSVMKSFNITMEGVLCHFTNPENLTSHGDSCKNVFWYAIVFQLAYAVFTITSIRFLILSQSAVFTVAAMSCALPMVGIWWTLFHASPSGLLVWSPKLRGEFICSIIGLPIVAIGVGLLCKAHFEDIRKPRRIFSRPLVS